MELLAVGFQCTNCAQEAAENAVAPEPCPMQVNGDTLECVDKFCYLGDMIGSGGGAEEASMMRVKCAWGNFRELSPILTARRASLKLKGKVYHTCAQSMLVYGSETWAMEAEDIQRLERTEWMMNRWMCGEKLSDRKANAELLSWLGIESVSDFVKCGRLR